MDLGLKGKRAIITGGSRGIGFRTALLLAREGCSIAFCGRNQDDIDNAEKQLKEVGDGSVFGKRADLENQSETRDFARFSSESLGGIDLLIHNASGFDMAGDESGWMRSFQVDIMAGVRLVDETLEQLKTSTCASITFVGAVWFEGGSWDKQKQENPKFYQAVERSIPLGRLGTADEIARIIAFVASPAGLWINSTHISADGGQVATVD